MQRRNFSREFKLEAVKLIKERGVAVAEAVRDIDVAESCSATLASRGHHQSSHDDAAENL